VLYVRGILRKIEGRFRLAFVHWGIALPSEHVRERGEYQDNFCSLSRSSSSSSSIRSSTCALSPDTSRSDFRVLGLAVEGESLRAIRRALHAAGFPSPTGKDRWHPYTVKRVVLQEA